MEQVTDTSLNAGGLSDGEVVSILSLLPLIP